MFCFRKSCSQVLLVLMVVMFNCCLPTAFSFYEEPVTHHIEAEDSNKCEKEDKPQDIKVLNSGVYNFDDVLIEDGVNYDYRCFVSVRYFGEDDGFEGYVDGYVVSLWGYSSGMASGVFRL